MAAVKEEKWKLFPATPDQLIALSPSPYDSLYPESIAPENSSSWLRVTDDAQVLKFALNSIPSEVPLVPVLHRVFVHIEGRLPDSTVFLSALQEEFDFMLGQATVAKGVEMAVCNMRPGETALLRCGLDYNYSAPRRPPTVPENTQLFFKITVLRYEKEKNPHEMSAEEKLGYAESRRSIGKELFAAGKYRSALTHYERALSVLNQLDSRSITTENQQRSLDLVSLMQLNSANCKWKLKDYAGVVTLCSAVLHKDPRNTKALFRRAEALKLREEFLEARKDYSRLINSAENNLEVEESVRSLCSKQLQAIERLENVQKSKEQKKLGGFLVKKAAESQENLLYNDMPDNISSEHKEEQEMSDFLSQLERQGGKFSAWNYFQLMLMGVKTAFNGLIRRCRKAKKS
jgi:tetratricopeptide (TPR) repeat protein